MIVLSLLGDHGCLTILHYAPGHLRCVRSYWAHSGVRQRWLGGVDLHLARVLSDESPDACQHWAQCTTCQSGLKAVSIAALGTLAGVTRSNVAPVVSCLHQVPEYVSRPSTYCHLLCHAKEANSPRQASFVGNNAGVGAASCITNEQSFPSCMEWSDGTIAFQSMHCDACGGDGVVLCCVPSTR